MGNWRLWTILALKTIAMLDLFAGELNESGTRKLAKFDTFKEYKIDE
jgi:hypothetical protein